MNGDVVVGCAKFLDIEDGARERVDGRGIGRHGWKGVGWDGNGWLLRDDRVDENRLCFRDERGVMVGDFGAEGTSTVVGRGGCWGDEGGVDGHRESPVAGGRERLSPG